jgi:hypothetical protein
MMTSKHRFVDFSAYTRMPTFVLAECSFFLVTFFCLIHAWTRSTSNPAGRRRHILLFIFSVIGGCANDLLFMTMPLTDNFWHSQATIMLTDRLPLYILCVYASFLYLPIACVWRLGLPILAEVCLAGLSAIFFYAPFDLVGIKFLWWTWHDSDTVVAERIVGVPVSSTMWVGVYTCCFAFLFNKFLHPTYDQEQKNINCFSIASTLRAFFASFLSVPLMMLHMMIVQCVLGGFVLPPPPPNKFMLAFTMITYGSLIISSIADASVESNNHEKRFQRERLRDIGTGGKSSHWLLFAIIIHYLMLICVSIFGDPTTHLSTGIHQTYGKCGVESIDYAGAKCEKFVCDILRVSDSYSFNCDAAASAVDSVEKSSIIKPVKDVELEWYSICGLPTSSAWKRKSIAYSSCGLIVFLLLIGVRGYAGAKRAKVSEE